MANSTSNAAGAGKKGLWARFKNYLVENGQMIFATINSMNGYPGYAYFML